MKRFLALIAVTVGSLFVSSLANEAEAGGIRVSSSRGRRISIGYSRGVRPVFVRSYSISPYYVSPYYVSPYRGNHFHTPFGYSSPVATGAPSNGFVPRYVNPYPFRPGFGVNVGAYNHGFHLGFRR